MLIRMKPGVTLIIFAFAGVILASTRGRDLTLSYKGGGNTMIVPANVPVVTFGPATRGDLIPGKKVFAVATPRQQVGFVAQRVVVETDGVAPPMLLWRIEKL